MGKQVRRISRNNLLSTGIRRHGGAVADKAKGKWRHSKKGDTRTAEQKKAAEQRKAQLKGRGVTKFRSITADLKTSPLRTNRAAQKSAKLRKSITAGTVLIVLAGRFRGKRVVFLKQLKSGLLLVTGPYKINGVPLRRVNQAYCIATSTRLDISKIDVSKIDDAFFARVKSAAPAAGDKKDGSAFLDGKNGDKKKSIVTSARKTEQTRVDGALLSLIKGVPNMKHYLNAKFSLTNGQKPHTLKF